MSATYERDATGRWTTVPHGTYSRYTHGACRCDECREANRLACWLRRNGLGPGRRPITHGIHGYNRLGCRCRTCRAAKSYWNKRLYLGKLVRQGGVTSTAASTTRAAPQGA